MEHMEATNTMDLRTNSVDTATNTVDDPANTVDDPSYSVDTPVNANPMEPTNHTNSMEANHCYHHNYTHSNDTHTTVCGYGDAERPHCGLNRSCSRSPLSNGRGGDMEPCAFHSCTSRFD